MSIRYFSALFLLILFFLMQCTNPSNSDSQMLSIEEQALYTQKGKEIALATFAALSSQLQKAMANGGVPEAIKYCNAAAYPIVDSLSVVHEVKIKRSSLKLRNPKNKATALEQSILKAYQRQEKELKPIVKSLGNGDIAFFAPIKTQGLCLKCHGRLETDIQTSDYSIIKTYYPEDEAIGYGQNELRGIWSIQFKK